MKTRNGLITWTYHIKKENNSYRAIYSDQSAICIKTKWKKEGKRKERSNS